MEEGGVGNEMAQWVKVLGMQVSKSEFDTQNPHEGGKKNRLL